jgi:ParB-like chromosome segregation protein Spo0J
MKVTWTLDFGAQFTLGKLGIAYTMITVRISLIDRRASAENRARETPLDKEKVQLIVNAVKAGAPLPSIVLRERKDGRFVVAGGNHRFNAAVALEEGSVTAYVIKCTDAEFETLCKQLNTTEGDGAKASERCKWAAQDILRENITQADAAERYGLSVKQVAHSVRLLRAQNRLDAMATAGGAKLTSTHINVLGDLAHNDNVLQAAAELIADGAIAKDVQEVARRARIKNTEAEQVAEFAAALDLRRELASKPVKRTKRTTFLAWISNGEKLCKATELSELEILESETQSVKDRLQAVSNCLQCLCKGNG